MRASVFPVGCLIASLLVACAALDPSFSEEIDRRYDPWLGQSKHNRILMAGQPDRCVTLRTGEEICSWRSMSLDLPAVRRMVPLHIPSSMHHVVFVFDPDGIARSWHYSGTLGERSSGEAGSLTEPQSDALLP